MAGVAGEELRRTIGRRTFDFGREVAVMAIVNRTPDSFYARSAAYRLDAALAAVDRALAEQADWLDVGGVPAAPGQEVSQAEELRRVLPVVAALAAGGAPAERLRALVSKPELTDADVAAAARLVEENGGRERAELEAERQLERALAELQRAPISPRAREELAELAHFIVERDF
jgi:dihydropteroate synthase